VATLNVILNMHALPVFVDSDLETAQIDAGKIEAAITDRTAVMIPVHLAGGVADLDKIMPLAGKRQGSGGRRYLPVAPIRMARP